jgi:GTP cyclohydrolase I
MKIIDKENLKEAFIKQFGSLKGFNEAVRRYKELEAFKINENVFENNVDTEYDEKVHFVLRWNTGNYIKLAFQAMKIDLDDPNVAQELESGNIGTYQRIAKMWCGADTHDDRELLGGRFHKPVRLAKFPNSISDNSLVNPIIKEVDLTAVCSHHLAPFSTKFSPDAKVIVSYIPDKYVLGISKLQRVVRYVAQRGWLQEDLTKAIYDEIVKVAETESVYVKMTHIVHSCESLRGCVTDSDGFTTEYFGGHFKENKDILEPVRNY